MAVVVFGSINMDLVARTPRLPAAGETVVGHQFETIPGGKGANQAVAIARLGTATQMIGRVGNDGFGQTLITSLKRAGVGCDRLLIDSKTTSGIAVIEVEDSGENHIIIIPGANGQVDVSDVERLQPALSQAQLLLLQLEVPLSAVVAAAYAAHVADVRVILDPAPARSDLPAELYPWVDILTPNQVEASQLVGFDVHNPEDAYRAATILRDRGVKTVIIKLGRAGVVWATAKTIEQFPAYPVEVVDTVAAGDAFNGGLAAALDRGRSLPDAIMQASAVAALSVTKPGAQSSLPTQEELDQFLRQIMM
jgi:ribokinase